VTGENTRTPARRIEHTRHLHCHGVTPLGLADNSDLHVVTPRQGSHQRLARTQPPVVVNHFISGNTKWGHNTAPIFAH
jgi:hypothetical protein